MQVKEEQEFSGFPAAPKQPRSPTLEPSVSHVQPAAGPVAEAGAVETKKKRPHKRRKVEDIPAELQVFCFSSFT